MPEEIKCPKCGSDTIVRTLIKGTNTGYTLYVCLYYPECQGKVEISEQMATNRPLVEQGEKTEPSTLLTELAENTSGQGKQAEIPYEIQRWNWGALFLNWIWGIFNGVWISLFCFVPFVGWIVPFLLGAYGNELAWRNKEWNSIEHFKRTQRTWSWWGLGMFIFFIVLLTALIIFVAVSGSNYE